jgi:hypothetical protein
MAAGRLVLMVSVDDPDGQRSEGHFVDLTDDATDTSRAGGGVRLRPWSVRWALPDELDAMAAAAGLELVERWGGWDGAAFDETSATHVSRYRPARRGRQATT